MESSGVQSTLPEVDKKSKSKTKVSKVKSPTNRKRFQLFDPTVKSDLLKLCDGGVVQLLLENEDSNEKDNSVSLDFDGSSSEDEVENLPGDDFAQPQLEAEKEGQGQRNTGLFCGSCNVGFPDLTEQRLHYTLDWHRYNVKRKVHGQSYVAESKFYEMMDDLSSIDGSDNEEEDVPPVIASGAQIERLMEKLQIDPDAPQVETVRLSSSQKMEQSPRIFLKTSKGQIISCFKTIVSSIARQGDRKTNDSSDSPVSNFLSFSESPLKITIIMASGGHFAAAVFDGNACTNHKTFHSYTVRAKQGGGQGSRDSKSGTSHPKSAGASLRRYNEQSFTQHIQELLASWKSSIADSHLIFYRAAGSNANIFFGGKSPPLNRDSPKVRRIPLPTKRPTFNEVKRVHSFLTTAHVYESMDAFLAVHTHFVKAASKDKSPTLTSPSKAKKTFNRAKSRSPKRKDELDIVKESDIDNGDEGPTFLEEVDQVVDFNELKEYDDSLTPEQRKGPKKKSKKPKSDKAFKPEGILGDLAQALQKPDLETFQTLISNLNPSSSDAIKNEPVDSNSSTLLHLATKNNHLDIVWSLMDIGCDPIVKDKSGKCPYNYADSRECRDVFRKFMGQFPEKYDYKKAQVPPPLSEEMEKERAEKKKQLNKLKREKEKLKLQERKKHEKETEEQRRFLGLSDREKRALAAEQRILAQCKRNAEQAPVLVRCFECAADITGKVPFEYNQNVFCTPKCLAVHRKKFPTPLSVL
ncbi:Ankyrin repeat and zinc finger domain-containing protein 1 [Orchesella cincta]|uniref:Ankyrin repeat and zinc finger domain-containing protein 1 n=1 Tax=Orchesella cincta TaxID=48709 RepID=A0A1D2M511_ORCCI|nr:Ankyrin repeat and zinc finger domain-containing protein 1 [Orchesella cincta]